MPAPIAAVGSMMVKGVFKAGGLLTGLGSMVGKLKGAQQESKSTSTEMRRMTGHAHLLRNALAMIGVGGFSALLMQTPALAGGLAKIKTEMMLIANAAGRVLKPAVDAVATILQGIRTGDWSKVKAGVLELGAALIGIGDVIIDFVFGEGTAETARGEVIAWIAGIQKAWDEGTIFDVAKAVIWPPVKWAYTGFSALVMEFVDAYQDIWNKGQLFGQNVKNEGFSDALRNTKIVGKGMQLLGYDRVREEKRAKIEAQGGPSGKSGWVWNQPSSIEKQENTFNIDMQGITGDIEDPSVMDKIYNLFTRALTDKQATVTV